MSGKSKSTETLEKLVRERTAELEKEKDSILQSSQRDALRLERAMETLRMSEEKYRSLVNGSIQGVVIAQEDPVRLSFANPAMAELTGYDASELESMDPGQLATLIHGDDRIRFFKNFRRRLSGESIAARDEYRLLRKNGTVAWVQIYSNRIDYLGSPGTLTAFVDITDRKKADERFRNLAEMLPEGVFEADKNLIVIYANRRALELSGYCTEDLSKGMSGYELFAPEERPRAIENLERRLRGEDVGAIEYQAIRKDGSRFPMLFHVRPVLNGGELTGLNGIILDITERKAAEEEKIKLEERYRQAQKMEAIGRLAGGVAHDFNNILCAIMGNSGLILESLPEEDLNREMMEEISIAAERAALLTRQLLSFSRKQVIAPMVINLSDLVESLHAMLARLIGEDIILKTVPQKGLGRVRVDQGQIEQVVLNLAINARDAMPDGGQLLLETYDEEFDEEYCRKHPKASPGSHVVLAVSDTGFGMSLEVREKIFEPFYTTKELGHGTGLGLATVFGAVEQNGGIIEVDSEPGKGSVFRVCFPRVEEEAYELVHSDVPISPSGHETVLVVEDEGIVRSLAVRLLKRLGYKVMAAGSVEEAIAIASRDDERIDLLLTDVIMPHMNGRELAAKITEILPEIEVIYTSGYSRDVISKRGILDDGVVFVEKPYTINSLAFKIRQVLGGGV